MTLTKEDISNMQIDPVVAVSTILQKINGDIPEVMTVDPANPLAFLVEAIAFNASALRDEMRTKHLRTYSRLANSESDLYNNMSYREFKNIFAQPANNTFRFFINLTNFQNNAIEIDDYKVASIPEMSTVTAEGYSFLLANRIDIKQFANGTYSIEQNVSSSDVGVSTLGILPHKVIVNDMENNVLYFDTIIQQLTLIETEYNVLKSESFLETIILDDKLHYVSAYIVRNGVSTEVKVTYSEIIDPDIPTLIVKPLSDRVELVIPDVYIINDIMVGKLVVSVFTTKGVVDYPLDRLASDNFVIEYNNLNTDSSTAVINNIEISSTALARLTGGTNGKNFEELRNSIITNSIGDTDMPITKAQLLDNVSRDGYYGYLLEDTVTTRKYIASRTLLINNFTNLQNAKPDILIYKSTIVPSDLVGHTMVVAHDDDVDTLVIKPNTLFVNDNGVVKPLSVSDINYINTASIVDRRNYLNQKNILLSPYSYISSIKEDTYSLRVIDFKASVDSFNIKANNNNVLPRSNIVRFGISKNDSGYNLIVETSTNNQFDNLDPLKVKAQLRVPISESNTYIYFQANYIAGIGFSFDIETDFYVDEDLKLRITNGESDLPGKYIDLSTQVDIITYYEDSGVELHGESYLNSMVRTETIITALTLETLDITFGINLQYLNKNMSISYTDRKYKRYDSDLIATYKKTIYDTDGIGSLLTPINDNTAVEYTVLHSKFSQILDPNGNPIVLAKEGDIIIDEDGEPEVDLHSGIVKYIDILFVDYANYLADRPSINDLLDSLYSYYLDMEYYNTTLLGETEIAFKPFRDNNSVKYTYNKHYKAITKPLKPMVELMVEEDIILTDAELLNVQNTVGACIHHYLNQDTFYLVDIKEKIMDSIGFEISAVRIILDRELANNTLSTLEKIKLADPTNRMHIAKKLTDVLGSDRYVYDVEINITNI